VTPRRAIVNADDFGWSPAVTDGILRAHREGIVTSATLTTNMPDADRAAALAAELPTLGVGVHLNACQGRPLSPSLAELADADGVLRLTGPALVARCLLRPRVLAGVLEEFDAQVRWAVQRGLRPTHLDSHRHVHAYPPLLAGVVRLARRHGVPFVRWPREHLRGSWPAAPASQARTARLLGGLCAAAAPLADGLRATGGTWGIAHTGQITAAWLIRAAAALPQGTTEIMVHPGLPGDLDGRQTRLAESRPLELEALCDPAVRRAFDGGRVELVHYGQLRC